MNIEELRLSLLNSVQLSFSRSGGPGGQNVNKVNTKTEARIRITDLLGLTESEKERTRQILINKINSEDELILTADDERSQSRNRSIVLLRMENLIVAAAHPKKARRKTKPTKASIERRLTAKKNISSNKNGRRPPSNRDE